MKVITTTLLSTLFVISLSAQMVHEPGEIIAQFKTGASPQSILNSHSEIDGIRTDVEIKKLLSKPMNIYLLSFDHQAADERALLLALKTDPRVLNAQFNHQIKSRATVPDDPGLNLQWHHINSGSNNGLEDADIDSDEAWDITTGGVTALGDTIVVCIIEGGNLLHPELIGNAWFNYNEIPNNGIDDDGNGYIDDFRGWDVGSENDQNVYNGGHGTNVMGMIGAKGNNGSGTVGANWNVKMMSVSGENLGNEASVVEAYTYPLVQRQLYDATDGALGAFVVVTNASWGIDFGNPAEVPIWSAFYDTLGVYGILSCGATANNNVNIDEVGDIPTAVPSDYMISVTATNSNDIRTFSGFGLETVDLGAPGQNVYTTAGQNGYTTTSGTSFASPLTAGVVALLYAAPCPSFAELMHDNPQGAADYVRYALFAGVDPVANLLNETATGGRLNAFNSLNIIMGGCDGDLCLAPFSFNYELSSDTVYSFTWSALSDATLSAIRYREIGAAEWTYISDVTGNNYVFNDLPNCTAFEFEIASQCFENVDELTFSNPKLFTTKGCCINPVSVATIASADEVINVEWSPDFAIESYHVNYRLTGEIDWIFAGVTSTGDFNIIGLEPCAFYDVQVISSCAADSTEGTLSTVRTKGCGICIDSEYCPAMAENSSEEHIAEIAIGAYSNVSGNNGGYELFENNDLSLEVAGTYAVNLVPGFSGTAYTEYFTLWLDANQDGNFEENEVLIESPAGSSQPLEGEITIPGDALLGNTRLRISMKYVGGNIPDDVLPCEVFEWGETEDYCLEITASTVGTNDRENSSVVRIFPNPTNGNVNLGWIGDPINSTLDIYDLSGRKLRAILLNANPTIDLSDLASGIYTFNLRNREDEVIQTGKIVLVK